MNARHLLRFADEDTRTSFVFSVRIYWDADYAEKMIAVQEYWYLHAFFAAIDTMENMLAGGDRDPANLEELASLYEQVGAFGQAAALREEELERTGRVVDPSGNGKSSYPRAGRGGGAGSAGTDAGAVRGVPASISPAGRIISRRRTG